MNDLNQVASIDQLAQMLKNISDSPQEITEQKETETKTDIPNDSKFKPAPVEETEQVIAEEVIEQDEPEVEAFLESQIESSIDSETKEEPEQSAPEETEDAKLKRILAEIKEEDELRRKEDLARRAEEAEAMTHEETYTPWFEKYRQIRTWLQPYWVPSPRQDQKYLIQR